MTARPIDPNEINIKTGDVVQFMMKPSFIDSNRVKANNVFVAYIKSYNTNESFEVTFQDEDDPHQYPDTWVEAEDNGLVLKKNNRFISLLIQGRSLDVYVQTLL